MVLGPMRAAPCKTVARGKGVRAGGGGGGPGPGVEFKLMVCRRGRAALHTR